MNFFPGRDGLKMGDNKNIYCYANRRVVNFEREYILSSSSSTEETPRTKPTRKEIRMAEFQSPEQSVVDREEVNFKDLFVQLNSIEEYGLKLYVSEPEYGRN